MNRGSEPDFGRKYKQFKCSATQTMQGDTLERVPPSAAPCWADSSEIVPLDSSLSVKLRTLLHAAPMWCLNCLLFPCNGSCNKCGSANLSAYSPGVARVRVVPAAASRGAQHKGLRWGTSHLGSLPPAGSPHSSCDCNKTSPHATQNRLWDTVCG